MQVLEDETVAQWEMVMYYVLTQHVLLSENMIEDMNKPAFKDYIRTLSSDKYGVDRDRIPTSLHSLASFRKISLD